MNKILKYGLVVITVFMLILLYQNNNLNKKLDKEIELRKQEQLNIAQLLAEKQSNTNLILTQKEALKITSLKIDSLSKVLKIRPKTIDKIVEQIVIIRDTIDKEIFVSDIDEYLWFISDTDKCFIWEGEAEFINEELDVKRTYFDYHNKVTDVFWSERPNKFLFIRYGKKQTYQKSIPECGTATTREITIRKK
jgi:hypothetical protein